MSRFAEDNHIPVVRFGKGDRKIDVMRRHLARQASTGGSGVAAIGVAQEFQKVFAGTSGTAPNGVPWFSFTKADRRVTCFYFYLWDIDFGPAFIKICAYFPYPIKVWVNGHEWAKRQAAVAGIGFTALSNGFATCDDPAALQEICDRLGPGTISVFFERWMSVLPVPLTEHDRADDYWWELSMRQVEVSRTLVFDAPRRARAFFEALVADNLDIGRPDTVELIFTGPPRTNWAARRWSNRLQDQGGHPRTPTSPSTRSSSTPGSSSTSRTAGRCGSRPSSTPRTICAATAACASGRAAEPRPVPSTVACSILNGSGRVVSLRAQPLSGSRVLTLTADGRRAPALRFGDPRVMALFGALCVCLNALGFTNRSLRAQVSRLLGVAYTVNQMSYDLGRLRLNGLIERIHDTNTYLLTPDGQRVAIFYTKVHNRLLRPLLAADEPPAPIELRAALRTIDQHVHGYIDHARLRKAA